VKLEAFRFKPKSMTKEIDQLTTLSSTNSVEAVTSFEQELKLAKLEAIEHDLEEKLRKVRDDIKKEKKKIKHASGQTSGPKLRSMAPGFVEKAQTHSTDFKIAKEEAPKSQNELHEENEKLKARISFLESEIVKKDAQIKYPTSIEDRLKLLKKVSEYFSKCNCRKSLGPSNFIRFKGEYKFEHLGHFGTNLNENYFGRYSLFCLLMKLYIALW